MQCRPKRRYQATTDSAHSETRFPNLLAHGTPTSPDQFWQADLTDVRVKQGFVYLAYVLDSFTREIVGWSMSRFMDAALPLVALNNALATRGPAAGLLHHSDQRAGPIRALFCPREGAQYASRVYVDRLRSMGVPPSMSRKGNPYDSARMESFCKTLKNEEVDVQDHLDLDDAEKHLDRFIGALYNQERLHSSLGYLPPVEFAARYPSAGKSLACWSGDQGAVQWI